MWAKSQHEWSHLNNDAMVTTNATSGTNDTHGPHSTMVTMALYGIDGAIANEIGNYIYFNYIFMVRDTVGTIPERMKNNDAMVPWLTWYCGTDGYVQLS